MPAAEARLLQREGAYREFLTRVRGDMERCLLQNTVIDLCVDDFARMQEEEALKGTRSDKPINEVISCMDIRHCRDMRVSQLRWHPQLQRLNAVCCLPLPSPGIASLSHSLLCSAGPMDLAGCGGLYRCLVDVSLARLLLLRDTVGAPAGACG